MKAIARAIATLILMMLGAGLYAQHTDAQIDDSITTYIIPNNTKSITAQQLQDILQLLNDNKVNQDSALTVTAFDGDTIFVTYWNGVVDTLYKNTPTGQLYSDTTRNSGFDATYYYVDSLTSASSYWTRTLGSVYPTTSTDSVGVGTTNPNTYLEVVGPSDYLARFRRDDLGSTFIRMDSDDAGYVAFGGGANQPMILATTDTILRWNALSRYWDIDGDGVRLGRTGLDVGSTSPTSDPGIYLRGDASTEWVSIYTEISGSNVYSQMMTDYATYFGSNDTSVSSMYIPNLTSGDTAVHFQYGIIYDDTYWKDATVSALSLAGGAQAPSLTTIVGGIKGMGFNYQTANDIAYGEVQLNHDYKYDTDVEPHLHWSLAGAPVGGNDTVVIEFEYAWADIDSLFVADTITLELVVNGKSVDTHYYTDIGQIAAGSKGGNFVSSLIPFRIERKQTDASDTYPDWWILHDIDFHYQIDSPGSDDETTK